MLVLLYVLLIGIGAWIGWWGFSQVAVIAAYWPDSAQKVIVIIGLILLMALCGTVATWAFSNIRRGLL